VFSLCNHESHIMNYLKGNLLDLFDSGYFNVIVHGCNCFHKMGAGIALQIKKRYPQAYEVDLKTSYGDRTKLGTISVAKLANDKFIINAYTQYFYGRRTKQVDYQAIKFSMFLVKECFGNLKIGIPRIGAGLAGGNWKIIEQIIDSLNFPFITCVTLK